MLWQITAYTYTYTLAGAVTLVAGWMSLRRRAEPGLTSLALALLFITLWCFTSVLELTLTPISAKVACLTIEYVISTLFSCLACLFVLEYYRYDRWLTLRNRRLLWSLIGLDLALVLTNHWHHLIWTGYQLGPPGSNLIFYTYGSVYPILVGSQSAFGTLAILVGMREAARATGAARRRALKLVACLLAPLVASFVYIIWPDHPVGLDMLPLAFSVSGLLIAWITFEDVYLQVRERTVALERTVTSLRTEIRRREQLEAEQLQAQDTLATRLADQSHKLAGLYNLILISGQSLTTETLLSQALQRIGAVFDGATMCFFQLERGTLALEAQSGLDMVVGVSLGQLPTSWIPPGPDVRADLDLAAAPDLPPALARAGFGASLGKWVYLPDRVLGLLCAFWPRPRPFAVEDIALFGAMTDELGVILENARLREVVANSAMLQERRRLARDLHDSVTQSLHSLVLSAETATQLHATQPERLARTLAHLAVSARQALKEMRLLLYELRLDSPFAAGLVQALQTRLDAVERRAGIETTLRVDPATPWPKFWERELYPIAMEALNNALKHARAAHVTVRLGGDSTSFTLEISDDGCGFDADDEQARAGGIGLAIMAERAERLGGRLVVRSTVGGGTQVVLEIGEEPHEANPNPGG